MIYLLVLFFCLAWYMHSAKLEEKNNHQTSVSLSLSCCSNREESRVYRRIGERYRLCACVCVSAFVSYYDYRSYSIHLSSSFSRSIIFVLYLEVLVVNTIFKKVLYRWDVSIGNGLELFDTFCSSERSNGKSGNRAPDLSEVIPIRIIWPGITFVLCGLLDSTWSLPVFDRYLLFFSKFKIKSVQARFSGDIRVTFKFGIISQLYRTAQATEV